MVRGGAHGFRLSLSLSLSLSLVHTPVQAELDRLRDALAAEVQRAARAESEAKAQLAAA